MNNSRNDNQFVVLPSNVPPSVEYLNPRETKALICEIPQFNAADDGIFAVSYDRRGQYILTGSSKVISNFLSLILCLFSG